MVQNSRAFCCSAEMACSPHLTRGMDIRKGPTGPSEGPPRCTPLVHAAVAEEAEEELLVQVREEEGADEVLLALYACFLQVLQVRLTEAGHLPWLQGIARQRLAQEALENLGVGVHAAPKTAVRQEGEAVAQVQNNIHQQAYVRRPAWTMACLQCQALAERLQVLEEENAQLRQTERELKHEIADLFLSEKRLREENKSLRARPAAGLGRDAASIRPPARTASGVPASSPAIPTVQAPLRLSAPSRGAAAVTPPTGPVRANGRAATTGPARNSGQRTNGTGRPHATTADLADDDEGEDNYVGAGGGAMDVLESTPPPSPGARPAPPAASAGPLAPVARQNGARAPTNKRPLLEAVPPRKMLRPRPPMRSESPPIVTSLQAALDALLADAGTPLLPDRLAASLERHFQPREVAAMLAEEVAAVGRVSTEPVDALAPFMSGAILRLQRLAVACSAETLRMLLDLLHGAMTLPDIALAAAPAAAEAANVYGVAPGTEVALRVDAARVTLYAGICRASAATTRCLVLAHDLYRTRVAAVAGRLVVLLGRAWPAALPASSPIAVAIGALEAAHVAALEEASGSIPPALRRTSPAIAEAAAAKARCDFLRALLHWDVPWPVPGQAGHQAMLEDAAANLKRRLRKELIRTLSSDSTQHGHDASLPGPAYVLVKALQLIAIRGGRKWAFNHVFKTLLKKLHVEESTAGAADEARAEEPPPRLLALCNAANTLFTAVFTGAFALTTNTAQFLEARTTRELGRPVDLSVHLAHAEAALRVGAVRAAQAWVKSLAPAARDACPPAIRAACLEVERAVDGLPHLDGTPFQVADGPG